MSYISRLYLLSWGVMFVAVVGHGGTAHCMCLLFGFVVVVNILKKGVDRTVKTIRTIIILRI